MSPNMKPALRTSNYSSHFEENARKYRLIFTLTSELLILGLIIAAICSFFQFTYVSYLLFGSSLFALLNLILLKRNYSIELCGHIINILCLITMIFGNLWIGGVSSSYISWLYVSPIIAAATIGLNGLIIYSALSSAFLIFFVSHYIPPIYIVPGEYLTSINAINHLLIFFLIFTTLYNLLTKNKQFEALLKDQNFILQADKKKFHYLANHDSLTNLPNRSFFYNQLQKLVDSLNTKTNSLTLFFLDLDDFKNINDQYGHEIGDTLILQVGKRLKACFREKDFIARLGGDEFTAIIIHKVDDPIANELFSRIESEFKQPFHINKLEIQCSISIGLARYPSDTSNFETLVKIADDAMYKKKKMKYKTNNHV